MEGTCGSISEVRASVLTAAFASFEAFSRDEFMEIVRLWVKGLAFLELEPRFRAEARAADDKTKLRSWAEVHQPAGFRRADNEPMGVIPIMGFHGTSFR